MSDAMLHNWKPADEREEASNKRVHKKRKANKGATRGASKPQPRASLKDYRPLFVKFGIAIGLLAMLTAGFAALRYQQQQQNFVIRSIEITGSREFVTSEQVSTALQQYAEGDFFNLEIDSARESLLALPWVREVSLRREWPDRLIIKLREQQAVARWQGHSVGQANITALLNEQAQAFAGLTEVEGKELPELAGPEGSAERVLSEYASLNKQFKSQGIAIQHLALGARNTWQMTLNNGLVVHFLERNKAEALERLATALRVFNADELKQAAKIDLRYSNGFAIEWSNGVNSTGVKTGSVTKVTSNV